MPSLCASASCTFGADSKPQFRGKLSQFCAVCQPADSLRQLSSRGEAALVGVVRKLSGEQRAAAFAKLQAEEPEVAGKVAKRVRELDELFSRTKASLAAPLTPVVPPLNLAEKAAPTPPPSARDVVRPAAPVTPPSVLVPLLNPAEEAAPTTPPSAHDATRPVAPVTPPSVLVPQGSAAPHPPPSVPVAAAPAWGTNVLRPEMQEQGEFPFCSLHAVAVTMSHTLQGKYGLFIEACKILDVFFETRVPEKAQWPDAFVESLGTIRLRSKAMFFAVRTTAVGTAHFDLAARGVAQLAGYRCVVVVMWSTADRGDRAPTHTVVAVRRNSDGTLSCQNSWGCSDNPIVRVCRGSFVRAFFIDPSIVGVKIPQGSKAVKGSIPEVDKEWACMCRGLGL